MVDRRSWPAKQYMIEPEPQTPEEWLSHSKRNLAYSYNAAIRACATFPEAIEYYNEMKVRGVLVDVDTAFTLISRAARYERMAPEDVFKLWDELVSLGAKCDAAVLEALQTVWDHSAAAPAHWGEARRRQLVDSYNELAMEDIANLGADKRLDQLMLQQLKRAQHNLAGLGAMLRYEVYASAIAQLRDWRDLVPEVLAVMRARAPADVPVFTLESGAKLEIPDLSDVLVRTPRLDLDSEWWNKSGVRPATAGSEFGPEDSEDMRLNQVILAALERVADAGFFDTNTSGMDDKGLAMQLLVVAWFSKMYITADVFAQLMDIVRFSNGKEFRDRSARSVFRRALRGANIERSAQLERWQREMLPLDTRVVARYITSVDPWSEKRFDLGTVTVNERTRSDFEAFNSAKDASSLARGDAGAPDAEGEPLKPARSSGTARRAKDVDERMASVRRVIERYVTRHQGLAKATAKKTGDAKEDAAAVRVAHATDRLAAYRSRNGMQLITAQLVFLRDLILAEPGNADVCHCAVRYMRDVKGELDEVVSTSVKLPASDSESEQSAEESPLSEGPETEGWESMLVALKAVMDANVDLGEGHVTREKEQAKKQAFAAAAELRAEVVQDSAQRFNGKFRMLWLEEA